MSVSDEEGLEKLEEDLRRLKTNREKVPLEELRTRYAKAYNALLEDLKQDADWYCERYIESTAFPVHPEDVKERAQMREKTAAVLNEERRPGGRVEQYRSALIDDLDRDKFEHLVWEIHERLEREVYRPYWQRHCFQQEDGQWFNDIIKQFWDPGHGWWGSTGNERYALYPAPEKGA